MLFMCARPLRFFSLPLSLCLLMCMGPVISVLKASDPPYQDPARADTAVVPLCSGEGASHRSPLPERLTEAMKASLRTFFHDDALLSEISHDPETIKAIFNSVNSLADCLKKQKKIMSLKPERDILEPFIRIRAVHQILRRVQMNQYKGVHKGVTCLSTSGVQKRQNAWKEDQENVEMPMRVLANQVASALARHEKMDPAASWQIMKPSDGQTHCLFFKDQDGYDTYCFKPDAPVYIDSTWAPQGDTRKMKTYHLHDDQLTEDFCLHLRLEDLQKDRAYRADKSLPYALRYTFYLGAEVPDLLLEEGYQPFQATHKVMRETLYEREFETNPLAKFVSEYGERALDGPSIAMKEMVIPLKIHNPQEDKMVQLLLLRAWKKKASHNKTPHPMLAWLEGENQQKVGETIDALEDELIKELEDQEEARLREAYAERIRDEQQKRREAVARGQVQVKSGKKKRGGKKSKKSAAPKYTESPDVPPGETEAGKELQAKIADIKSTGRALLKKLEDKTTIKYKDTIALVNKLLQSTSDLDIKEFMKGSHRVLHVAGYSQPLTLPTAHGKDSSVAPASYTRDLLRDLMCAIISQHLKGFHQEQASGSKEGST